ncbi:hypothetical protein [Kribbella monticola]|uniref:hypothetical protein n=1 Tax=Kribbella monticola TaxID=2185285 RepID=UPI000DD4DA27|nr:hypothetical protein [Kribbella monticola]
MPSLSPLAKLIAAGVAFAVLVVGGLIVRYAGAEHSAIEPAPSVTSGTPAEVVPSRNPRRDPDVDRGTPINYGVFVEIPRGWTRQSVEGILVTSPGRGAAQVFVVNHPVPSAGLLRPDVEAFADTMELENLKIGTVRQIPPPNLNVSEAFVVSFTSHYTEDGVTYQLSGDCTRLRGLASINDVSVSLCYVAQGEYLDAVRAEVTAMSGSVARSI